MSRFKLAASLALVLLAVSVIGRGFYYASYEPETSDGYIWGAYHVHSTLSDGMGSPEQIAQQAREARVGFVLLTDHGLPNQDTSTMDETIQGVRFIGGSEAGLPEGHIDFFGTEKVPLFKLPPYPPEALEDIREWGGFAVLTYPDDLHDPWQYWEPDFVPDGMEVLNITSYFRSASVASKLDTALFSPFSRFHFLKCIRAPTHALNRWEELLRRGRVLGFYACNAHGGFDLVKGVSVPIPSYRTAFSLAGLGIRKDYQGSPQTAVRSGDFFSVLRGAGEPRVFDFFAESSGRIYPSGSSVARSAKLTVRVETATLATRLVLKRDGKTVASTKEREIRYTADAPGTYRSEVYLDDHAFLGADVPWILSNPIFVDHQPTPVPKAELACESRESVALGELGVENDEESSARYEVTEEGGSLGYHLSKATPQRIDRWVALALRKKMDLSPYAGFYIDATSSDTMRYWVEVRSGERSFYSSFKLYPNKENRIAVSFDRFYAMFGKRSPIPLDGIDSLFITVNTSNTVTGFDSALAIRDLGFCRR